MANLWNRGYARSHLMGTRDSTMNPSAAAKSLLMKSLGKKRYKKAIRKAKRRRSFHKGNPLPALVGILGSGALGKLGGRFRKPSEQRAAAVAPQIVAAANAGNLTAAQGLVDRAAKPMIAKEHAVWAAAVAQVRPDIMAALPKYISKIPAADQSNPEAFAQSVTANAVMLPGTAAQPGVLSQISPYFTPGNVGAIARAAGGVARRGRRQRYPTYVDRYGRQRYSTKPPGSQMRLPAGATPSPESAYSFFSGAIGKGGAGTTAAQLGVAAAAGAAAYFGTQAILKHFGGQAVRKEEAGVKLALAARDARKEYALAHNLRGAPPSYGVPASVIREIGAGMKQQLAELGYNAQGVRTRSGTERFLADYAPEED